MRQFLINKAQRVLAALAWLPTREVKMYGRLGLWLERRR